MLTYQQQNDTLNTFLLLQLHNVNKYFTHKPIILCPESSNNITDDIFSENYWFTEFVQQKLGFLPETNQRDFFDKKTMHHFQLN